MGFMLMTRTRVTARARPRPAAPAPHLSRARPPAQKSRQRNCHRASPGVGKRPAGRRETLSLAAVRLITPRCSSSPFLPVSVSAYPFLLGSPSLEASLPTSIRGMFSLSIKPRCWEHFGVPGSVLSTEVGVRWGYKARRSAEVGIVFWGSGRASPTSG